MSTQAKATSVVIILDRSNSMNSIRQAMIDGINSFRDEVRKAPGEGYWSLVQFDDPDSARGAKEPFPNTVYSLKSDAEVPELKLEDFVPRGNTALIDALYITLTRLKTEWLAMAESERPHVLIQIVTDGAENKSTEFTNAQLRELTAELQTTHGWLFAYMGANQDSFAEAQKMGIQTGTYGSGPAGSATPSVIDYTPFCGGVKAVWDAASAGASAWRADNSASAERSLCNADQDKLLDAAAEQIAAQNQDKP